MIKIFIIVVVFVTGHQCKTISDEVPVPSNSEERTADISNSAASKAADSENTQELSKEASVKKEESIDKSEKSEQTEEIKAVDSKNTGERHVRSTEESRVANVDDVQANAKTSIHDARRAASSETSEDLTKTSSNESNDDKSSRASRNSEETYSDATQARSDTQESKSGSLETETAERDDASHINIKETRKASEEESIEAPSYRSSSESNSKSASTGSGKSKIATRHPKNAAEATQLRSGNQEEDTRSSSDSGQDDARSGSETDVGVEALVRSDIASLANPTTAARRMLDQNSNLRYDTVETPDLSETSDTRMAPQEYIPMPGHQVHSNYFGSSRSSQSQYPYSPLERSSSPLPFLPFSFSKEFPSVPSHWSKLLPPMPTENLVRSAQNSIENNHPKPLSPPMDPNKLFSLLPAFPPLDRMGLFKPLPPLPPLDPNRPFQLLPPLPPLEPIGSFRSQPQLPPLEPFGSFRSLPQFPAQKLQHPFSLMDHQAFPDPSSQWKPTSPTQYWQPERSFPNIFSSLPLQSLNTMSNLPQFKNPLPNTFSMLRQAEPEASPQTPGSFSRSWESFESTPTSVRSAVSLHQTSI